MRYFYLLALRWLAAPAAGQAQVPTQRLARSNSRPASANSQRPVLAGQRAGVVAFTIAG